MIIMPEEKIENKKEEKKAEPKKEDRQNPKDSASSQKSSISAEKKKVAQKRKEGNPAAAPAKAQAKKSEFKSNFKFSAEKDPWKILQHPVLTEKNIRAVETENKLAFIVRREASKPQIKWAVESALAVRIEKINTLIDRKGRKKAIIKLAPEFKAVDIATRFGML